MNPGADLTLALHQYVNAILSHVGPIALVALVGLTAILLLYGLVRR